MSDELQVQEAISKLDDVLDPDGSQLTGFRFILKPVYKSLPNRKSLEELYIDHMEPQSEREGALKNLWFALKKIGTANLKEVENLFGPGVTSITVDNGEVLYRACLCEVAIELTSDVNRSKKFIRQVTGSRKLRDCSHAKVMPPEEKQQTESSFLPPILKLFEKADEQAVIDPSDLHQLEAWLEGCTERKLCRLVSRFKPFEPFHHTFTVAVPKKLLGDTHKQCSADDQSKDAFVPNGGKLVSRARSMSGEISPESPQCDTKVVAQRFAEAHQESVED